MLQLTCDGWTSGPILVAETFKDRLLGLFGSGDLGLLLKAKSVHSFGMARTLTIAGLDSSLTVKRLTTMGPWRVVVMSDVEWILELPECRALPTVGDTLSLG